MKRHGLVFALAFLASMAASAATDTKTIPHMDLEMTGQEIRPILQLYLATAIGAQSSKTLADLQPILDLGKRNLDWLKFINDHRDAQHKISFSSADTQAGIPIESPRIYNPEIILGDHQKLLKQIPQAMKDILLSNKDFPASPPVSDSDYILWGRKLDNSYEMAARWILMEPWLWQLEARKADDIRGYYFLSKEKDLEGKLKNFAKLPPEIQKLWTSYLTGMCVNVVGDQAECDSEFKTALGSNQIYEFYERNEEGAAKVYNGFFRIEVARNDIKWNKNPEQMHVPFTDPADNEVKNFLADNIQDEWKWGSWNLLLDFGPASDGKAKVEFEPNATPHVNGLAGNTITMDANQPLTEYNVRWTIRHEFGHVLGFPDCYVEFYDRDIGAIVSYQLDITNIMCSRRGHLQRRHYDELKLVYDH